MRNFNDRKDTNTMLARLRFIRELVKECQFLRKQLRHAKLSQEERRAIKDVLCKNQDLIASLKEEVQPVIDKFNDTNIQIFVEQYYFLAKTVQMAGLQMAQSLCVDSVRSTFERSIKKFWKLHDLSESNKDYLL